MDRKGRVKRWWWDSNPHDTFWGLCSSAESTALLEADGPDDKASLADTGSYWSSRPSSTNLLGSVTAAAGFADSSTEWFFHLFVAPTSITLFNRLSSELSTVALSLSHIPETFMEERRDWEDGLKELQTMSHSAGMGMLWIRVVLNMVPWRSVFRFQLWCALAWPRVGHTLALFHLLFSTILLLSLCLEQALWRRHWLLFCVCTVWYAFKIISVLFEGLVYTPACTTLILMEVWW